jgi:hypothetical protein
MKLPTALSRLLKRRDAHADGLRNINFPAHRLQIHEAIVADFLEEARHAHQQSLPHPVRVKHYRYMRENIPVNPSYLEDCSDEERAQLEEAYSYDDEIDVRNLLHHCFVEGDATAQSAELLEECRASLYDAPPDTEVQAAARTYNGVVASPPQRQPAQTV